MPGILITDDNRHVRRLIRQLLEAHAGWQVCGEAENGQEALEKAQQLKPDLVILDLSMPVMNGLDAARALRRAMPNLPLIMFTSFQTDYLQQEALAAGVNAVVIKTDSLAILIAAIHSLLERAA